MTCQICGQNHYAANCPKREENEMTDQPKDRAAESIIVCYLCDEDISHLKSDAEIKQHLGSHGLSDFEVQVAGALLATEGCDHFCCGLTPKICHVKTAASILTKENALAVAAVREVDAVLIEDAIRVLRIPDVPRYGGDDGPVVKRTALGLAEAIRAQDPNHASAIAEIERRAELRVEDRIKPLVDALENFRDSGNRTGPAHFVDCANASEGPYQGLLDCSVACDAACAALKAWGER